MIDKLRAIAIFSAVVDQGTFRAAALHLGLAPSRVSQTVSDLEKSLGVTLLYRSTRQISLTHEGRTLHEKALQMLAAAEDGLDAISPLSKEPAGALRISLPAFVTQTGLLDPFADFAKKYPMVSLDLHFTDQRHDLIKEGFDVAIRAGWLEDSELLTRRIGNIERLLVASPDYCASKSAPAQPEELEEWDWIKFAMRPGKSELTSADGDMVAVMGQSHVLVNSADALYEFAVRGLGLTAIPEPEWSLSPLGIHAVWPDHSRRENLTTIFVRFLAEHSTGRSS